jgi:hypothetical protein
MMYSELLEGIFRRNNLTDEAARAHHLRDLQPYAKKLWESYRAPNVIVDYADLKTQEAYLLRYFPFYWRPLIVEMGQLYKSGIELPRTEFLEAAFFGCGPGPEILGLMRHLSDVESPTTMMSAHLIDSAADTWACSRNLVLEHLAEPSWEPNLVDYVSTAASFTDREALASAAIDGCLFAVVQNCLNEVPSRLAGCVVENLMSQFARLAPGAIVLVIDRSGYEKTKKMMQAMHEIAVESENIVSISGEEPRSGSISCSEILDVVPDIVKNNLFYRYGDIEPDWSTDRLIFAENIKYVSRAFQVR